VPLKPSHACTLLQARPTSHFLYRLYQAIGPGFDLNQGPPPHLVPA
jgi:hypothetical protein